MENLQAKHWHFKNTPRYRDPEFKRDLAPRILRVFRDGMGINGWSINQIVAQKKASTLLGLLKDSKQDIFGYCFVTIPSSEFQGKKVLWMDACSISRQQQASGYYGMAIRQLLRLFDGNCFGYLGGRTQNPVIMYSHDKFGGGRFFPFDAIYPSDLMQFLIESIHEVQKPNLGGKLNKENGLCRGVYSEGILGKYPLTFSKGRSLQFEEELKEFGFNRNEGDAIIIVKQLN